MTTTQHDETPKRGRPRKEETQERRRRRNSGPTVYGSRLGVNKDLLDFDRYAYRWINDKPGRLIDKTKHDDWDIMMNDGGALKEDSTDLGNAVSFIVGTHPDGSPMHAYLARKLKTFYEDDKAEKMKALDEQLNQMRRGLDRDGASQSDYVRESRIS